MVDNIVPTITPQSRTRDVLDSPKTPPSFSPLIKEKDALFDSLANEEMIEGSGPENASLRAVFTGLLWFGYAVAVVVAIVLVWSAAKELLK